MNKKSAFKFAEGCLYRYLENKARIEALREELRELGGGHVKVQSYDERTGTNNYIDNVPPRIVKIDDIERQIVRIERRVLPIERLIKDLESPMNLSRERREMLCILQMRYFNQNTWDRTIEHMGISIHTFVKRRRQLVAITVRYLGVK
ncbi:hypothetical protein FACS1894204_06280 [Synergistales bacterium]|nr:hypothetical protein FACS1894204_06280 [Synergistales bacterium]